MPRPAPPPDLDALAARAAALVEAHGALPRGEVKAFRKHLVALTPALETRGYEVGATVRRPLAAQLAALVAEGPIPVKGLDKRLAGATAREVKELTARLVASGAVTLVHRPTGPALASSSTPCVEGRELDALLRRLDAAQKLLRKARRAPRAAMLRADVVEALAALSVSQGHGEAAVPERRGPPAAKAPNAAATSLALEIARRVGETSLPLRVPDLLRALGVPLDVGRSALLDGAAQGLFQLEPESGMGRLSREEADLCPPGPFGTRLSWVRAPRAERGRSAT
jgi:hypothetical protein